MKGPDSAQRPRFAVLRRPVGSRLRVLQLINLADDGGAERFALGLATHLPQDRFEPWMCSPRGTGALGTRELADAGVPLVNLGRRAKWDAHRLAGLARLLRRERFDVLHAHMHGSNLWGSLIGRACRVPVVIAHEHTWSYQGDPLRAWVDGRVIGRLVTRFVAVSNADAERMVDYERVPASKVVVMPTAYVPSPPSPPGATDIRGELGLEPGVPLIAMAVVFRPQKALEVMLEAHSLLAQRVPDAQLLIAGDGPPRPALEQRTRELGIERRVHFLGQRTDIDRILSAADVGALSSDFEGMPLFTFECMANDAPLVATAVGALPDVVENGVSGILVPPRDPSALARALAELLTDPARRARIAQAAEQRLAPFRIQVIADRFAELYESLVAERESRNRAQVS
jgi:glycosyltransferase involved in cell wall biosynthesis